MLVLVLVLAVKHVCGGVINTAWLIFEDVWGTLKCPYIINSTQKQDFKDMYRIEFTGEVLVTK